MICELDNPMRDPGDGTIISATNISIVTYAGDGMWCRQEDVYNPLRFVVRDREVVQEGRGAGHAARRGRRSGCAKFGVGPPRRMTAPTLVIGANGYLGSHVTRQLVADGQDVRVMVRDGRQHHRHRRPRRARASSATSGTTTSCARR